MDFHDAPPRPPPNRRHLVDLGAHVISPVTRRPQKGAKAPAGEGHILKELKMSLLKASKSYKPFEYPWAYDFWKRQQQIHWMPEEVPLGEDCRDWAQKLTEQERNLRINRCLPPASDSAASSTASTVRVSPANV